MLSLLILASVVVTVLFLRADAGRAFAMSGGLIGLSLVQVVNLYRTRSVGFSRGHQVLADPPRSSRAGPG
jgi:hypothetical protein